MTTTTTVEADIDVYYDAGDYNDDVGIFVAALTAAVLS